MIEPSPRSDPGTFGWWLAALLGVVLGLVVGLTMGVWPQFNWPASSSDWAAWVQAVGTILAVLMAAGIAVWQASKATEQETIRHQRDIWLRRQSAFVTLPMDLAYASDYVRQCYDVVMRILTQKRGEGEAVDLKSIDFPILPSGVFERFRQDIPFLDDKGAQALTAIAAFYQIQKARLEGIRDDTNQIADKDLSSFRKGRLVDLLRLQIMIDGVWGYAREAGREPIRDEFPTEKWGGVCLSISQEFSWRHADVVDVVKRAAGHPVYSIEEPYYPSLTDLLNSPM